MLTVSEALCHRTCTPSICVARMTSLRSRASSGCVMWVAPMVRFSVGTSPPAAGPQLGVAIPAEIVVSVRAVVATDSACGPFAMAYQVISVCPIYTAIGGRRALWRLPCSENINLRTNVRLLEPCVHRSPCCSAAALQPRHPIGHLAPGEGRKTRYRHGVPTYDNKNPMFCIIAYSPSKKLSLVQNSISVLGT
jgi:hypothetical protein